jgi:predicted transposase YdaD
MAQDYDVTLKVLLKNFPQDFARVIFKNADAQIELLNLELPATKHYTDALLKMTVLGETFILHVEFLSSWEKDVPERMHSYAARIEAQYPGFGVYGAVLYINEDDRDKPFPNFYERRILGELRTYHKFDVIKIWELDADDILRQQIIGLLPVVALMRQKHEAREKVLRDAIQQVQQKVEDPGLRAEMYAALYLFSGLKQLRALVTKLLKEANMLELLKKSETYQEILAVGKVEGKIEGKIEGRREGWMGSILSILHARFGDFAGNALMAQLQSLDDDMLNKLVVEAISVDSLEAFQKLLAAPQRQAGNGQNL